MTNLRYAAALVAAVLATAGCNGARPAALGPTSASPPAVASQPAAQIDIAKLMITTPARQTPTGPVVAQLATTVRPGGGPTELLVLGRRTVGGRRWLRVLLAQRPNGSSGWIRQSDVTLHDTQWAVIVSLADRRLYAVRRGHVVRSFAVVTGARATPTPTGHFAVSESIPLGASGGFYGTWMLTLTAHSTVLDTFAGGDGQVAIHGRGGASLAVPVGTAASHGCVRMRNANIDWLARRITAGTPVVVTAGSLQ